MKHKLDFAREKTDKIIRTFTRSYMNNSKWVKLLTKLSQYEGLVNDSNVKMVWDDKIRKIIIDDSISFDYDFYAHSMEGMVSGYPKGLYDYKEIEWVEFPCGVNNLPAIENVINSLGRFEMEYIQGNLRLYGYK